MSNIEKFESLLKSIDEEVASSMIEKEGFKTVIAEDGLAAIEIINQQQPDFRGQ